MGHLMEKESINGKLKSESVLLVANEDQILTNKDVVFSEQLPIISLEDKSRTYWKDSELISISHLKNRIVITIPAFNEEKTIGKVIEDIKAVMNKTEYCDNYVILVVNDGSNDKTVEMAKEAGAVVYSHLKNFGLADTFRTEMRLCLNLGADIIVHTDADGQYLPSEIPFLISEVENGYDLVLGSRFLGEIEHMPRFKRFGNKAFSYVLSKLTKMTITDGQTGFRAFTREVAEKIPIVSKYTYTQEQIIRCVKEKYRVNEIPIYFAKRKDGNSRLMRGPLNYAFKAWRTIIRVYRGYYPMKFFGLIGGFMMFCSLPFGAYWLYKELTTGIQDYLWLIVIIASFIIIGIQTTLLGFVADTNKT